MVRTHLIDGRALADAWLADIAAQVRALGAPISLAAVAVSGDEALAAFVRLKRKAAQLVGIDYSSYFVDDEAQARETLTFLAADDAINGIFVELPLPPEWDTAALLTLIPPEKDLDALLPGPGAVLPPAVAALRVALDSLTVELRGLHAAVIGRGMLIGAPITRWLREQGATVDVIDIDTPHPSAIAAHADLLVSGAGTAGLINASWVKQGATVIDFGFNHDDKGRVVGDVAPSGQKKAGAYTPVPGGMGPLVVAAVMENLVTLATR